jgi:cobalt-zinc-cadmium efflux system outer membrane protein
MRPYPELAALETLVAEALAGRPEVRAGELALEAAAARADLHRRDVLQLTAILDANALEGGGLDDGPGVEVELPVFGRRSGSELTRAEIEAQRAAWQMVETRRRIGREVREARLSYERAYAALGRLRSEVLPVLEEAQRTAERAAELGATSGLVPVEAEALWLAAQRTEVTLETELELARGELERSVGRRLDCASP